jgi:hypothetical protein
MLPNKFENISQIEIDLLLLFYTFSNQYGEVDTVKCQKWAKEKMGIYLPSSPFTLTQEHIDILVDNLVVPNVTKLFDEILFKYNK